MGAVLFVVNGLGLGNSTRCLAVMEELVAAGATVHVLTSGNGLAFFQGRPEVASLTAGPSFYYSQVQGRLSALKTCLSLLDLARLARLKSARLGLLLDQLRPAAVVFDSEYSLGPAKRRGLPTIALNNADVVVSSFFAHRRLPTTVKGQFWLVEFSDYLFHRLAPDLVLSPSLAPWPARHGRIRRVGLIVRRQVRELAGGGTASLVLPRPSEIRRVVLMISGSALGMRADLDLDRLPWRSTVVGRPGRDSGRAVYLGRVRETAPVLAQADLLVVNGGFSAVSEAVALGKPTLVVPVPNHAEQHLNALAVQEAGRGWVTAEETALDWLLQAQARDAWPPLAGPAGPVDLDGAAQAAAAILEIVGR